MMTSSPVSSRERENFLDILRGFALLGIYIANLNFQSFYNGPSEAGGYFYSYDETVHFLQTMLIEGKFYTIFSLLFGWGVAMQMQALRDRGAEPVPFIKRRLWVMLLLGFMHALLLWTGDIVAFYAMLGFLLLLFRNTPDKKLLVWSGLLILSPILLYFLKMKVEWINAPAFLFFKAGGWLDVHLNHLKEGSPGPGVAETDSWIKIWKLNIAGISFRYAYLFFVSRISKVLGMFLLGYYLGRNQRYKKVLSNNRLLLTIALIGFVVGLPANYGMAHFASFGNDYFDLKMNGWYQTICYALGVVPLGLAYAASLALLYNFNPLKKILMLLQPLGKMAFTNYVMQSFISLIVFSGIGLAKGGQLGPTAWTLFGIGVFFCQMVFSHLWLRYFQFGPVEWFWRSMTYRKWQSFRKYKV